MKTLVSKAGFAMSQSRIALFALMGAASFFAQQAHAENASPTPVQTSATDGPVMRVTQCSQRTDEGPRDVAQVKVTYFETRTDALNDETELRERKCDIKYLDARTGVEQPIVFAAPVQFAPESDRQTDRPPSMIGFSTLSTMAYDQSLGMVSDLNLEANISPFKGRGLLSRTFGAAGLQMMNGKIGYNAGAGVTLLNDSVSVQGGYVKAPLGGNVQINRMLGGAVDTGLYAQADAMTKIGKLDIGGQVRGVFAQNARQVSAFMGTSYGPVTVKVNYVTGNAQGLSGSKFDARYQGMGAGAYVRFGSALGMDLSAGPEYQRDSVTLTNAARPNLDLTQRLSGPGLGLRLSDKSGSDYRVFGRMLKGEDMFGRQDSRFMFGLVIGANTASNPKVVSATAFDDKSYRDARMLEEQRTTRRGIVIVEDGETQVASTAYRPLAPGVAGPVLTAPPAAAYRPAAFRP